MIATGWEASMIRGAFDEAHRHQALARKCHEAATRVVDRMVGMCDEALVPRARFDRWAAACDALVEARREHMEDAQEILLAAGRAVRDC